ncbi:LysE/ArgO family amino acid transporter [Corynebacterium aquilae]|uniref:Lysine transporter LysE n=1 Tax=Corynebacterium aquilae DSM 44791 TaxID=1431546 RepID=A0A1L7CFG9_9CORY|nr:LysE/ArgO family amino acid transporter [Corynebacterium aquilae]APT84602.1 lysine transporter LysE [Corynebacterium aquilae DSM 44791]
MSVALHGFLVGLSLIIAIGPQNALILKQGLKRQHVGKVIAVCAISDIFMISAGTAGVGIIIDNVPWLLTALTYGGAAYLLFFAYTCFRDAIHPKGLDTTDAPTTVTPALDVDDSPLPHAPLSDVHPDDGLPHSGSSVLTRTRRRTTQAPSWKAPVIAAFVLTWLNPGAYIDTIVMLGGLANQEGAIGRWYFAAGAIAASMMWFPTLGFGAQKLSTPLSKPAVWRGLNIIIGFIMIAITARLLMH